MDTCVTILSMLMYVKKLIKDLCMKPTLSTKIRHYLIDMGQGIREFCARPDVNISPTSFRSYFDLGNRAEYDIAKRIVAATKNHITMEELGYKD